MALSALFELAQKAGRKYGDEVIDYLQDFLGGLPPETADRLVRASEQGYDVTTPYYHGTGSPDITMFQGERGSAGHFSRDPKFAENFAYEKEGAPAIYPVYLRHGKQFNVKIPEDLDVLRNHLRSVDISLGEEEAFQRMKLGLADYTDLERLAPRIREAGFNSYVDYEDIGGGPTGIAVFDPSDVRSVNAEFNPKRTKSGNILAGGAAAAVGIGAGTQSNEAEAGMLDMGLRTVAKPIERALRSADMERAVVRGAREVLPRTAPISAGEKSAILADIEKAGIGDPKEVMKLARDTRARFPSSGVNEPWSPFEITGVKVKQDKNGKITYDLKTKNIAYGFHVDPRTGKEAKRNSAYYQNMVNGVADEIIAVARLAENGDPAAKRIMENAGWYKNVEGRGFNEYGSFYDMFGDLLGATSPNTPVRTNFNFSNDILQRFSRGEFDDQIERYANSMDRVDELDALMAGIENTAKETPGMTVKAAKSSPEYKAYAAESASIKESLKEDSIRQAAREDYVFKGGKMKIKPVSEGKKYGINSDNAMVALADRWRIFRKGDAPKAKNFSGNLVGYSLAPTIDVWAARNLRRHAGMPPVPGVAEQGVTGQIIDPETFKNSLEFGFGQDVVSDATKKINDVLGLNLDPRDTQALQWFVEKDYWSKRGMTSAAGEGGSFETMMDLNPVESMVVGTSRAQSVDTQGVDFIPGPKDQLQAAKRFMGTAAEDPDVIAGKALTTKGMYKFGDETSFDIDIVSKEDMVPASTLDEVAKQAAADKQESFFAARRIKPEVGDARPELFNVGSEAYFKTPVSPDSDDVRNLYTFLTERDIPGFTLIMDPRQKPGEMAQKVIGVRFLDIPQFYDAERFANMSDAEYADHVRKTFTQYDDIGRQIEQDFGNIRTARPGYFDVNVKSRGSAEAYLAQLQNRQRDPDALRQEYWGFKPARSRFQEYAGQAQPYYLKGGESPVPATRAERAALKASQGGYADPAALLTTLAVAAPAAAYMAGGAPGTSLADKYRNAIQEAIVPNEQMATEFSPDDFRFGETKLGGDSPTGKPQIYINRAKLEAAGASPGYMEDMLLGEGIHLLKEIDPQRHSQVVQSAISDPEVMAWAEESYAREKANGEKRSFDDWFVNSRLDQIIGGYFFGGKNANIPTMRSWDPDTLPYGTKFRSELNRLGADLGIPRKNYSLNSHQEIMNALQLASQAAPAADFLARRQQKSERTQSMRQSILDLLGQADELGAQVRESLMSGLGTANRYAGLALEAPQVPIRGIQGLTALAGDLTAGQEPLTALSRAAAVSQQSPEQNAYEAGGAVTDATGSPLLGTAAYLLNRGLEFASPY